MYLKNANNFFEIIVQSKYLEWRILLTTSLDEPSLWRMADKHAGLVLCCGFRTGTWRRQQGYELQQIHVIAYEGEYTKIT